MTCTRIDIKI